MGYKKGNNSIMADNNKAYKVIIVTLLVNSCLIVINNWINYLYFITLIVNYYFFIVSFNYFNVCMV